MSRAIKQFLLFLGIYILTKFAICLENGLARTPPMGWLSWERFKCNINCRHDPHNCISENLFMEMANRLVEDGYRDAGYKYVNIDDCWMAKYRNVHGDMVPDPERFRRGIKFLSNYMHVRELKLGIYQSFGTKTCMGFPGSVGHMEQDAKKFAEWEVDMVKFDGCYTPPSQMKKGYVKMGTFLNRTGRPMVYSCSWPYYELLKNMEPNYKLISTYCNMWRNFHDIQDSWHSITETINFFGDNQAVITNFTGPGRWSDPDMLMIGNLHLNVGQARVQMAAWAIFPAPLLMSNDLRFIKPEFRNILLNRDVIAINQDALGIPGKRMYKDNGVDIWVRKITPVIEADTSFAILFINMRKNNKKATVSFSLLELGLKEDKNYLITEIFRHKSYGLRSNKTVEVIVPANDCVMLSCMVLKY
ncbi:alpha-N-acetylgalactosaminidase-like [Uloborus diversus]|uniref:alpha-N-acetylgalactosaminidase-like n=1 Tax=Uloborus diversus TaxID=327109 RepID=UPI00240A1350|nr:alpha-N-acetylgalactosaminidase-like [Uloborus diversus]